MAQLRLGFSGDVGGEVGTADRRRIAFGGKGVLVVSEGKKFGAYAGAASHYRDLMAFSVGSSIIRVLRTKPLMVLRASLKGMFNFFAWADRAHIGAQYSAGASRSASVDVCKTLKDAPQL